jgi:CRP/FNR family transcriptional regulator
LFAAGDPVPGLHVIVSGSVRILRGSAGRAIVVHREGPGGMLGEVALFGSGRYPGSAVAAEPTVTLLIPTTALRGAMRRTPALAELLLARLAHRAEGFIERLDRQAHHSVLRRLATHIDTRHHPSRRAVSLGMTQAELAEELGTVKEVIVRSLRMLRQLRLVEPAGRGLYRVVDPLGLRALAGP